MSVANTGSSGRKYPTPTTPKSSRKSARITRCHQTCRTPPSIADADGASLGPCGAPDVRSNSTAATAGA